MFPPPVNPNNQIYQELLNLQIQLAELLARRVTEEEFSRISHSVAEVLSRYADGSQYASNQEIPGMITTLYDTMNRIRTILNLEKRNARFTARSQPPKLPTRREIVDVRPLDVLINATFYSIMMNYTNSSVMEGANLKDRHIQIMLSVFSLIECMERSRGVEGIVLQDQQTLTLETCPPNYRDLAEAVLTLKDTVNSLSPSDHDQLVQYILGHAINNEIVISLGSLLRETAEVLNKNPTFLNIMKKVQSSVL